MRTRGSDNSSIIPSPAAVGESATTQVVLAFDDNRLASVLFGQYGQNLALVERRLGEVFGASSIESAPLDLLGGVA